MRGDSSPILHLRRQKEAESVLELLDKERREIEFQLQASKSSSSRRINHMMEEDLLMPALPVVYYEPKDTSRMNSEELRREKILRRHLKSKFFPSPPPHMLEKLLQKQQRRQDQQQQQQPQQQSPGGKGMKSTRSLMRQRERPWASGLSNSFEDSVEAQKIRNVFLEDSKKCAFHKSPYLQPQARFHTRDPGNLRE